MRRLFQSFLVIVSCIFLGLLAACGSSSSPDFSLASSAVTVSLATGATATVNVSANATSGTGSPISVTLEGLPAGVTASPATLSIPIGSSQTVTLTATSGATQGTATVTLTGILGSKSHTASFMLAVAPPAPPPDFSLSVIPATLSFAAGATSAPVTVTATAANRFAGSVAVTFAGLPAGVTVSPSTLTLTPGTAQNVTFTAPATVGAEASTVIFTGTSGSLSHTGSLALNVTAAQPPPAMDYTVTVAPTALTLTAGAPAQNVTVATAAVGGFSGNITFTITGLPNGITATPANFILAPGTPQNVALTAANGATVGASTVMFAGSSGSLNHAATLALTVAAKTTDVTTYHYDNLRTGLNANETLLTLANVNAASFGKLGFDQVDGKVDAQPLYLSGVTVAGTVHNVLYVATQHDSVFAFDADSGAQLWQSSILGANEMTSDDHNCNQITPEIGITATPVIDRKQGANGTLFVAGMSKDAGGAYHQRLHALDLTTGKEQAGSPTEVSAKYPGTGATSQNGMNIFNPGVYAERVGLLLMNGTIYTGWTSHCDQPNYTGWIMAYSESTLQQTQVLNLTPNGSDGSVWMSGQGLAADNSGNIYLLDANGTFDTALDANGFPVNKDYGNTFLKLSTANNSLAVADYFEPSNGVAESAVDQDLGSGGELLLPDLPGANGATLHLAVGAGKDTNIYFFNRDNLGKFSPTQNNVAAELIGALAQGAWSSPAYFNNTIFYGGRADTLKSFQVVNAQGAVAPALTGHSAAVYPYPGTTPTVSANGTQSGIVWAVEDSLTAPGVLHAYDATDLTKELYNSNQAASGRDSFGNGNKFITPVIVNGKVYVGTQNGVAVFGELH